MVKIYRITNDGSKALSLPNQNEKDLEILRFLSKSEVGDAEVASYVFDGNKAAARASIGRLLRKQLIKADI